MRSSQEWEVLVSGQSNQTQCCQSFATTAKTFLQKELCFRGAMTRRWALATPHILWQNTVSIMKERAMFATRLKKANCIDIICCIDWQRNIEKHHLTKIAMLGFVHFWNTGTLKLNATIKKQVYPSTTTKVLFVSKKLKHNKSFFFCINQIKNQAFHYTYCTEACNNVTCLQGPPPLHHCSWAA